jgi:hypothetical protein
LMHKNSHGFLLDEYISRDMGIFYKSIPTLY